MLLVVCVKSFSQSYPFNIPANLEATLKVDTTSKEKFNNLLLGTNIHSFKTSTEKSFINTFDPITVRFPHGLWSNWYDWRRDVSRLFGDEKFIYKQGTAEKEKEQGVGRLSNLKIFDKGNTTL